MRKLQAIILVLLALFILAGCAPGPNEFVNTKSAGGFVPGFWQGLWNGAISPITFIISLFNKNVQIYEIHNNGAWYNLGFLLGAMAAFGGGAGGAAARRRRR